MTLLDVTHTTDISFRLMDVIFICSGLLTVAALYWKLVSSSQKSDTRMDQLEKDQKRENTAIKTSYDEKINHLQSEILSEKNSKRHIKTELTARIKEAEEKIDTHNTKNNEEFTLIKTTLAGIDGKLDTLLKIRQ